MEICIAAASSTPLTEYNHRRFRPSLPLNNNNNNNNNKNKSPLSGAVYPYGFDRRVTPLRLRLKLQLRVTATAADDDDDDTTNFTQHSTHDISTLNNNASSTYNHSTQQQQQQQQPPSSDDDNESLSDESAQPFQDFVDDLRFKLDSEDSYVLLLYGGGSLVAVWLLTAIVGAIDALPVLPKLMEVVGLGYSLWFTTRYLLFKKNRKELSAKIEELKREVLGSDDD